MIKFKLFMNRIRESKVVVVTVALILASLILLTTLSSCSSVYKKLNITEDGYIEEFIETVIEVEFDMPEGSLDLSIETPEIDG